MPSFQFDSSYEADEVKKFVIGHVEQILLQQQKKQAQQVQTEKSIAMPAPIQDQLSIFGNDDLPPF